MARQGGTTQQWRVLRKRAFDLYGRSCVKCGDEAKEIDHIIELDAGGEDALENLQPLCVACHKAKTAEYNSKRMTQEKTNKKAVFLRAIATPDTCPSSISPQKIVKSPPMAKMV